MVICKQNGFFRNAVIELFGDTCTKPLFSTFICLKYFVELETEFLTVFPMFLPAPPDTAPIKKSVVIGCVHRKHF